MLMFLRIGAAFFALVGTLTGLKAVAGGLNLTHVAPQTDNDFRFFAASWLAVGLGFAWSLTDLAAHASMFRFLLVAVFLGGIARAAGWASYPPDKRMIVAVVLEFVLPIALGIAHSHVTQG